MTTTVRISEATHERLVAMSGATGRRMQAILEDAVAAYEAQSFWNSFESGYARLAENAEQWSEVQEERAGEATALTDDFDAS